MKSQQLKLFVHSYISEANNRKSYSVEHFMDCYSKEFCVDISYLDITDLHVQLSEEDTTPLSKKEITFEMLLHGISQGYLDNKTIDAHNEDLGSQTKLKFTTTQIVVGILIVVISGALLGVMAIYV